MPRFRRLPRSAVPNGHGHKLELLYLRASEKNEIPLHFISTFVRGYNKSNFSSANRANPPDLAFGARVMDFEQHERNQEMLTNRPYCCGNCPSYHDQGDGFIIRPDIDNKHRRGECRKNPPAVDAHKRWPQVYYLDFCGDHPSAPLTRQEQLLALMANRLESNEERAKRTMHVTPDRPF